MGNSVSEITKGIDKSLFTSSSHNTQTPLSTPNPSTSVNLPLTNNLPSTNNPPSIFSFIPSLPFSTPSTSIHAIYNISPFSLSENTFLTTKCHKIYVITAPSINVVKVGYTGSNIRDGVWKSYRRAYGEDLVILKIYPTPNYLEDLAIHKVLIPKYGMPNKGKEIYDKTLLSSLLNDLEQWHSHPGYGPFKKDDIYKLTFPKNIKKGNTKSKNISGKSLNVETSSPSSPSITPLTETLLNFSNKYKCIKYQPINEIIINIKENSI